MYIVYGESEGLYRTLDMKIFRRNLSIKKFFHAQKAEKKFYDLNKEDLLRDADDIFVNGFCKLRVTNTADFSDRPG